MSSSYLKVSIIRVGVWRRDWRLAMGERPEDVNSERVPRAAAMGRPYKKKERGEESPLLSRRSPQFLPYHLSTLFPQIAHTQLLATLAGLSYFADHREEMLATLAEFC